MGLLLGAPLHFLLHAFPHYVLTWFSLVLPPEDGNPPPWLLKPLDLALWGIYSSLLPVFHCQTLSLVPILPKPRPFINPPQTFSISIWTSVPTIAMMTPTSRLHRNVDGRSHLGSHRHSEGLGRGLHPQMTDEFVKVGEFVVAIYGLH